MKKKIGIVTATRAEYGILKPLIVRLRRQPEFEVQLYVTGTHLEEQYGSTIQEIEADGIPVSRKVPILEQGNRPYEVSLTMANALRGFAQVFLEEKPDLLIVLGDRTEMLGICAAAMDECIPIAHLHGGELTEGAVDDCVRHAITKMSYLHFPAAEVYRKRIIQMGESPDRVFMVGALGVENIKKAPLLTEDEIRRQCGIPQDKKYAVVTFHPVTMENGTEERQVQALIDAMEEKKEYFYLITKANSDAGGEKVNAMLGAYADQNEHVRLVDSLGMIRYLSAVRYAAFVLGNSSSGIIEAPALGTPTVNIGDRQKGRLLADTVISCDTTAEAIVQTICQAEITAHHVSDLYGDGETAEKIVCHLKEFFEQNSGQVHKRFYDLPQDVIR